MVLVPTSHWLVASVSLAAQMAVIVSIGHMCNHMIKGLLVVLTENLDAAGHLPSFKGMWSNQSIMGHPTLSDGCIAPTGVTLAFVFEVHRFNPSIIRQE